MTYYGRLVNRTEAALVGALPGDVIPHRPVRIKPGETFGLWRVKPHHAIPMIESGMAEPVRLETGDVLLTLAVTALP